MARRGTCLLLSVAAILFLFIGLSLPVLLSGNSGGVGGLLRRGLTRIALLARSDELSHTIGSDSTPVRFELRHGATASAVAQQLFGAGLIRDERLFVDYAFANGLDVQLRAGVYFLNQAQTIPAIAQQLADAWGAALRLRIFPGWRVEQIAAAIDSHNRLGIQRRGVSATGGPQRLARPGAGCPDRPPSRSFAGGLPLPGRLQIAAQSDGARAAPGIDPAIARTSDATDACRRGRPGLHPA